MGVITTSLVIDFDAGDATGILKAEVDDRSDGYNLGETSFIPGDSPYWLLFKSSNVIIDSIETSLGSNNQVGTGSKHIEENLTFAGTREVAPSYPISSGFTSKWLGTGGGTVTATETQIAIPAKAVAALNVEFDAHFIAYQLTGVPTEVNGETTFPIVIYIQGSVS